MRRRSDGLRGGGHLVRTGTVAAALVFTLAGCAPGYGYRTVDRMDRVAMEQKVANARTRADHEELAAMYQQHAEADKAASERHKSMAGAYRWPARGAGPPPMAAHCDRLVELYRQAAEENKALAGLHRAKAAETE